jgi:hypothetical protein
VEAESDIWGSDVLVVELPIDRADAVDWLSVETTEESSDETDEGGPGICLQKVSDDSTVDMVLVDAAVVVVGANDNVSNVECDS